MRYNPDTDRAIDVDAIAEQCRNAITANKLSQPEPIETVSWGELGNLHLASAKLGGPINRSYLSCVQLSHAKDVAIAMGNYAEARRLRAMIVAGLW